MSFDARAFGSGATPPQNLEAEAAVLGALLVSAEAMERVADILKPESFYQPRNGHIFRAAIELAGRNDPVDIITVRDQLMRLDLLEAAGGADYLLSLESGAGIAANVEAHARVIEEAAVRRGMLSTAFRIHELATNVSIEVQTALAQAEEQIFRLSNQRTTDEAVPLASLLHEQWEQIELRHENPNASTGVPSGFYQLDEMTGGFQKSQLIILAARPSVGKTSYALNVAQHVAVKEKMPVAIFSLEMSRYDLTQRLLCAEAGVDSKLVRTGKLSDGDWSKIANAMGTLSEGQIYIDDRPSLTILELRARARRLKSRHEIQLVVIDYLQLMYGSGKPENRNQEVSEISRGLKALARELDCPVIALSQLSRAPEQRADRRPQLSDLRESGCVTGETRVYLPDAGIHRSIKELVGLRGFRVMAVNTETGKLERASVTNAFSTGVKPVLKMTTRTGRCVRATANHKFLTVGGWRRLDELVVGDRIAVPRWLEGPEATTMPVFDGNLSRGREQRVALAIGSKDLLTLSESDIYWDRIRSIDADGAEAVFDLTVAELHNFVAQDVVLHNSLEQDADLVMFLYREGLHNEEVKRNKTELMVAKHRNGPIGDVPLLFMESQTKFVNVTRQSQGGE